MNIVKNIKSSKNFKLQKLDFKVNKTWMISSCHFVLDIFSRLCFGIANKFLDKSS